MTCSLIIEAPAVLPRAPHFVSINQNIYDFLHFIGRDETCFVQPDSCSRF